MLEAVGICTFRGQATGLSRNYVAARREPGGPNACHELPFEVRHWLRAGNHTSAPGKLLTDAPAT